MQQCMQTCNSHTVRFTVYDRGSQPVVRWSKVTRQASRSGPRRLNKEKNRLGLYTYEKLQKNDNFKDILKYNYSAIVDYIRFLSL